MRIDLSWGLDRARAVHPAAQIAEILLSDHVSARSFGPALGWLDVLFIPPKGRNKPLKQTWRWRGSHAEHLIVESEAPNLKGRTLEHSVRALIEAVPGALARAEASLDPTLRFDLAGAQAAVESCLAERIDSSVVQKIRKDLKSASARRMADTQVGRDLLRQEWKRPLIKPLRWVRVHPVGKLAALRGPLADACRMVGALIGSALSSEIETPGYDEIYVNLGCDETAVRSERTALEDWCENAWAVVAEGRLAERDAVRLRRTVFDAARRALQGLAEVDHLDGATIARLLDEVDVEGLSTVFIYRRLEKAKIVAEVTYTLAERKDKGCILQPIFYLDVREAETGRCLRQPIGPVDLWEPGRILTKLQILSREVRVDFNRTSLSFPLSDLR